MGGGNVQDCYLGIDLGTSAVKAVVANDRGEVIAQASVPLSLQRPRAGWSEQSPGEWWQASIAAVRSLPPEVRQSVQAVGLSGQMHGAVLLDAADAVLRPAILWNDGRSMAQCQALERDEPRTREITGNIAMPGFTAPKLAWVREHEPGLFARVATVLLPKDYLRLKLTGEHLSEMSDSAGTLWLDVGQRDWSDAMLAATGLTRGQMPALVEGSQAAGRLRADVARELGLGETIVAGGAGDNAASAVGIGVIAPGQAFLSLGTSGVLFLVNDRFRPNPARAVHSFCHAIPGRWHQMAVMLSAASCIDWVTALAGFADVPTAVAAAEARGLRADTPMFLPYLSGERTPHNDPRARGTFFRMDNDTCGADLVVAVLEGVAHGLAEGLGSLLAAGGTVDGISVVGGGSRLPYWLRLLATVLDRPLLLHSGSEVGAALGAARLAQLAHTGAEPGAVCTAPPVVRVVEPDPALAGLLRSRAPVYSRLYASLKDLYQEFPA